MTETNIFTNLFNTMITNYRELHIRMNHVSNDKNQIKIYQKVEEQLDTLKKRMTDVNNIIDNINLSIDDIYSKCGTVESIHPELIVSTFTESQSDMSYSDFDDNDYGDLESSTLSFNNAIKTVSK